MFPLCVSATSGGFADVPGLTVTRLAALAPLSLAHTSGEAVHVVVVDAVSPPPIATISMCPVGLAHFVESLLA